MAAANPVDANFAARQGILPRYGSRTIRRLQQLVPQTSAAYVAGQALTMNFAPAPVGIITRFIVKVSATISQGAAETQTRIATGAAAILGNVTYIDPSNNARVNVPGWYLHALASHRRGRMMAAALSSDINGIAGLGAAFTAGLVAAPATVTTPAALTMNYEVPLAYGRDNLQGAVLAGTINATQNLSVTINPNFFVTSTDVVNYPDAGYQSSTSQLGRITSVTVTVYQEYIDQIDGLPLPMLDLSTFYLLNTTGGYNPTANVDLAIPYVNGRMFMSTLLRYNNSGNLNAGTDLNYISIRLASTTDLQKADPFIWSLKNREIMGCDMPSGFYMISHRDKPLFTNDYGNLGLVVNASNSIGINSILTVGYEALALSAQLPAGGSLPTGT